MITYYQNDNGGDTDWISWNGSDTFHVGYMSDEGVFVPTDVFTNYGSMPGPACTHEEAHRIAKEHFRSMWGHRMIAKHHIRKEGGD